MSSVRVTHATVWLPVVALCATVACEDTTSVTGTATTPSVASTTAATPSSTPATATAATAATAATTAAAATTPLAGRHELPGGLSVDLRPDGTVVVKGKDRWGGKIDTTYESTAFLKSAAPVLARSVDDAAAAALTKLAGELP